MTELGFCGSNIRLRGFTQIGAGSLYGQRQLCFQIADFAFGLGAAADCQIQRRLIAESLFPQTLLAQQLLFTQA